MSTRRFLLISAIIVLMAAFYLKLICFVLDGNVDEGLMSMGGDLIARGGLIYRDFFSVVWPGSYFILSAFFKMFGATWAVARCVLVCELLIMLVFVLALSRMLIKSAYAFFPACYFVILGPAPWNFNYYHWDGLFFFLITATILARILDDGELSRKKLLLAAAAGVSGALGVICFQAIGPAMLLGFCTASALHFRLSTKFRQALALLGLMLLSFGGTLTLFLIYMIATGDLSYLIDMTLHFVVGSYGHVNTVPYGFSKFFNAVVLATNFTPGKELESVFKILFGCLCWVPYETIKMTPLLLLAGVTVFLARRGSLKQSLTENRLVWLFVMLGLGFFMAEQHRPDIVRLFWGSQLLIIVNFFFLEYARKHIPQARLAVVLTTVVLALGLLIDVASYSYRYTHNLFDLETRRGHVAAFEDWKVVEAISQCTAPNEKILVYPYNTTVYFLSQTWFPSHFPWLQYNYHHKEDFADAIKDMEASKVRVVVWDSSLTNESFAENGFPSYAMVKPEEMVMEKYLLENFRFVKSYGRFRLMKRKH
jgi:hypothetical protein